MTMEEALVYLRCSRVAWIKQMGPGAGVPTTAFSRLLCRDLSASEERSAFVLAQYHCTGL